MNAISPLFHYAGLVSLEIIVIAWEPVVLSHLVFCFAFFHARQALLAEFLIEAASEIPHPAISVANTFRPPFACGHCIENHGALEHTCPEHPPTWHCESNASNQARGEIKTATAAYAASAANTSSFS